MTGILLALSFLAGVLLFDSHGGWILAAPAGLASLLLLAITRTNRQRGLVLCCLVFVGLGAIRAQSSDGSASGTVLVSFDETDRSVVATIHGLPRASANRTHVSLQFDERTPRVSASLPLLPTVADGDVVRFRAPSNWKTPSPGRVEVPVTSNNELYVPTIDIVGANVSTIGRERTRLTRYMTGAIEKNVPEPAGALALGIMNGDDTGMTSATRMAFRSAGLSHITAVSGWNVAVLTGLIIVGLRTVAPSRGSATLVAIGAIWIYAFIVGMQPSVVRAAGMATVFLIAHLRGRPGDVLTSLLLTIAAMVAITPEIRFDVGFQLSVAATLGIVLLLEVRVQMSRLADLFAIPVVAQLSVSPLVLHHFGSYSLLAIVANLLTAPLVAAVMWFGLMTVFFAFWIPALAGVFGIMAWVPARLIIAVAETTASFRWASGTTVSLSWSTTVMVYGTMIGAYLAWIWRRGQERVSDEVVVAGNRI